MEEEPNYYTREDLFTADKDIVDSLKMEYSSLVPFQENLVRNTFNTVKEIVLDRLGEHIPRDAKERLKSSDDPVNGTNRILVLSEQDYLNFKDAWMPRMIGRLEEGPAPTPAGGAWLKLGDLIVCSDITETARASWEASKANFRNFLEIDDKTMTELIKYSTIVSVLTHETIHSCEGTGERPETKRELNVKTALHECGAHFLSDKIMQEKYSSLFPCVQPFDQVRKDKFTQLLGKYGEDLYDVLFENIPQSVENRKVYDALKENVYSEFTDIDLFELGILEKPKSDLFESSQ